MIVKVLICLINHTHSVRCLWKKNVVGKISLKGSRIEGCTLAAELLYDNYKWLCKIKHPTLQHIKDEVDHAMLENSTFAVHPIPDARVNAVALKYKIVIVSISRLLPAAKNFAKCVKSSDSDSLNIRLQRIVVGVHAEIISNFSDCNLTNLPISAYLLGKKPKR